MILNCSGSRYCQYVQLLGQAEGLSNEQEFEVNLKKFLSNFQNDDKKRIIIDMNAKFPNIKCLQNLQANIQPQNGWFQKATNLATKVAHIMKTTQKSQFELIQEYHQAKQQQDFSHILTMLENEQYFNSIGFQSHLHDQIEILQALQEESLKVLEIVEYCQSVTPSINIKLLKNILFIMINEKELDEEDHRQLLSFLGQTSSNFILQFQNLLLETKEDDQENYLQFIAELQQVQVGKKEMSALDKYRKNFNCYDLIVKILTLDQNNLLSSVVQQISQILQIADNSPLKLRTKVYDSLTIQPSTSSQVQQAYYLSLFSLWLISRQEEMQKYQYFQGYHQEEWVKNAVKKAIQDESDQLVKFLVSKFYYFSDNYEGVNQELERLHQEQKQCLSTLKGIDLRSPLGLFQRSEFFKAYHACKHISPNNLGKCFKESNLILRLLLLSQQLNYKNLKKTIQFLYDNVNKEKVNDICYYLTLVQQQRQDYSDEELSILFQIFSEYYNFSLNDFLLVCKLISVECSLVNIQKYLTFQHVSRVNDINKLIEDLKTFTQENWNFIKLHTEHERILLLATFLGEAYLDTLPQSQLMILSIFKSIMPVPGLQVKFQLLEALLQQNQEDSIHSLMTQNNSDQLSFSSYVEAITLLIQFISQNNLQKQELLETSLNLLLKTINFYELKFLREQIAHNIETEIIKVTLNLVYFIKMKDRKNLIQRAQDFYQKNPKQYSEMLMYFNYFGMEQLEPIQIERRIKYDLYPRGLSISLEEFNISLALMSEDQQRQSVDNWVRNMKDEKNFENLIPFFFNILKRGESMRNFLSLVNHSIRKHQVFKQSGYFNLKSLFQILFNNSNPELQVMLLKLYSKVQPIPLVYRTPYNEEGELELLSINAKAFYVFQQSYPIINFSLSEKQNRIGKTELINKIFYDSDKFEVCDTCEINKQTLDIMFDVSFSGSRNLTIADTHGFVPLAILDKVLPLFKMWIIQIDTEMEIESTLDSLQKLKSFQNKKIKIFLLIRNSQPQLLSDLLITKLQQNQIQHMQIIDFSEKDLNKQIIDAEIDIVANVLFKYISSCYATEIVNQNDFLELIYKNNLATTALTVEFQDNKQIIQQLDQELNRLIVKEEGFYSKEAFPFRSLDYKIKKLRNEYSKLSGNRQDDQQQESLYKLNSQIATLEKEIPLQQPTKLLELFCKIFEKANYYNLYLWFVDKLRLFNEHNTYQLQDVNQKINESITQLKKEKQQLKQKEAQNDYVEGTKERIQKINELMMENKKQLETNLEIISLRNIGIELFWREIISQQQKCKEFKLKIDPIEIVHGMIAKGEPFEFLDGDQLRIDQKFLQELVEQFKNKGSERILVLSVLGPQSSGKSTILNKIFGCHFWTSVGRCTKGIYLQILKIHNKSYFDNLFDYILLLDTEGLQNPNQDDQEFDKKIALFVLAISDIILINVKGDIHSQFKNLVEMCIFTLGQMRNFSSVKQISWCFNQNNDVSNFAPFLHQLQGIASNLNVQFSQNEEEGSIDYNEILGISKQNIQILGFASTEKTWRKSESKGIYSDWRQQLFNETFSEEAYLYGVRIIKSYAEKFKSQQEGELQNLKYFIQIIENNWESIQRLPDLLEFSELIQHQQNLLMKQEFDIIIKSKNIAITNDMLKDIHDQILSKGAQVNLLSLQELLTNKAREADNILDQVKEEYLQKLLQKKNDHKISKKIYTKYENMIKERIKSQCLECKLSIHNEIKNHETEFQKKRGFFQLDTYVSSLNHKPDELQRLKGDEKQIRQKFNQLWENILHQQKQSQEEMFKEFALKLFGIISEEFSNYILKSQNENAYQQYFFQQLIKTAPTQQDFLKIFTMFSQELKQQQFMVIERSQKNYQYSEIFYKKLNLKLSSSSETDLVRISQFYRYKITLVYVTQSDFSDYIKYIMMQDLKTYVENKKKYYKKNEEMINQINNFFSLLYFFGINYDQPDLDIFTNAVLAPGALFGFFKSDFTRDYQEFIQKFHYSPPPTNATTSFFKDVRAHFAGLKISYHDFECEQMRNEQIELAVRDLSKRENIILMQQLSEIIISKQQCPQYKIQEIFDYIKDPADKGYRFNEFKYQITITFTQLMSENNNAGWKRLYSEIYQMIMDETLRNQNQSQNIEESNEIDITQYNVSLIKIIMAKIEIMIKGFNKQFSNYGIIFNDLGQRCNYYFSIFIIWRLLCYGQWKLMSNNIEKLEAQTEEQYQKFKADIQQNKREQSILRGNTLAAEIYNLAIEKFYIENCKVASDILKQYQNQSSFTLVKSLDLQILEKQDAAITDEQIMEYIRNHSGYIEKYVNKNIITIVTQIQDKLQQLLRNEMKQHLIRVQRNTRNLKNFTVDPIKAQDYFREQENRDVKISYENILYKIVLSCLQGVFHKDVDLIKNEYQGAFDITGYVNIEVPLITSVQSSSDSEIQMLLHFISAFDDKISEMIKNCDTLQLSMSKLNVQTILDEMKFVQIGCLQTCPVCKRKCDQDPKDQTHRHTCQNGHQLRGMNGVLIHNNPSLFTCEEISDDFQIEEQETKAIKRWKEIKAAYSNWQFSCLSNEDLKKHKEKVMNIWNNKIGQMICKQLEKDLGQPVYYIPKHEIDPRTQMAQRKIHYVLIMDDSGSMSGKKWTISNKELLHFYGKFQKINNLKLPCVIDFETLDPTNQEKKIVFNSGGTDFDQAFLLAYEKIIKNPQFTLYDSHQMFFYTDGYASFPTRAMNSFKQLTREQKQRIELVACTEESQSPVLDQIVAAFEWEIARAEMRKSVQPQQMGQVWVEIIFKKYHKLEC